MLKRQTKATSLSFRKVSSASVMLDSALAIVFHLFLVIVVKMSREMTNFESNIVMIMVERYTASVNESVCV